MAGYIEVVNWDRFQHYKKDSPPWVKVYRDLLGDYEFMALSEGERWTLVGIWLLAAETNNRIPNEPKWLKIRLGLRRSPSIEALEQAGKIRLGQD